MAEARPGQTLVQLCASQATWIEFQLVNPDRNPVPGESYTVRLPDQSLHSGQLGRDGIVRFDGILPGQATIGLSGLDAREW